MHCNQGRSAMICTEPHCIKCYEHGYICKTAYKNLSSVHKYLDTHILLIFEFINFYLLVSLLKDLKHVNIVTLHDIIHTDQSLTLIFEYVVRG